MENIAAIEISGAALLGLLVGSFLNVVIYRLPVMLERTWREQALEILEQDNQATAAAQPETFNLVTPRSRCPACGTQVAAWQNIPVVSWLLLRGRCSSCGTSISARYPIIELLTGLLSGLIVWEFGAGLTAAFVLLLVWGLIALTMIDFDHQLLPDSITLPLIWLGLIYSLLHTAGMDDRFPDTSDAVVGAVAGYLSLWSVYWVFKLVTGKEGMGHGDFKLLAALGAWLGWQMLPLIILLSAVVGTVVGIALILVAGRDRQIPIPFGPYLAGAGIIALLWGQEISKLYLNVSGLA